MEHKRSVFSNKLGFVLAAAGSAVGLGNIWRFPYLAAKYGGGLFLLIYFILVITLGFTIMVTEIAIGRKTQQSPIGAYRALNKKFSFVGVMASLVAFLILPYYSVIGGWVMKYFVTFLSAGHQNAAMDNFFTNYIAQPVEPMLWQIGFVVITFIIVLRGVKNGIEKASRVLMPLLIVLSIIVAVYSITLPGALEGVKYFLIPNFSQFKPQTILAALGQMFYSLSLAMGIMITYGSYLRKEDDIEKSVKHIEIFDTAIAVLAGFMVIPAVFAFSGGNSAALNSGPGLMFQTLPKVFEHMGMAQIFGSIFFALVLFAALTSSISLMEAVVATFSDNFKLTRTKSCILAGVLAIAIGVPSSLGFGIWSGFQPFGMTFLDFMDFLTNSVLMPLGALITCVFVGYVITAKVISDEVKISSQFRRERIYKVMIKYIAPICILIILISSVLAAFNTNFAL